MLKTLVQMVLIYIHTITIIYLLFFKNYCIFFNIHISRIYHVSYLLLFSK